MLEDGMPVTADRVRWEHIQRVYELCDRNVSETARRLNVPQEDLAAAAIRDLLNRPSADFETIAAKVLEKNEELYRRLA